MPLITVPVRYVARATPRTRHIHLDLGGRAFPFVAGQAVMVGLHDSPLRKPYSIASAPWEAAKSGVLQLLAQVDDTGALDPHLELAAPGTLLDVDGPFGVFALPAAAEHKPLLFVAGGTGIAPLRSILLERLSRPAVPALALVYSARSPEEFAYRTEIDALVQAGRLTALFTVTRSDAEVWDGRRGRIQQDLLRLALPAPDAHCLLCGPPQLVADARELLRLLGVDETNILTDHY
ncbi:MAG: ferredoxin--NADP reductase [Vicinamibacterales bacterium]